MNVGTVAMLIVLCAISFLNFVFFYHMGNQAALSHPCPSSSSSSGTSSGSGSDNGSSKKSTCKLRRRKKILTATSPSSSSTSSSSGFTHDKNGQCEAVRGRPAPHLSLLLSNGLIQYKQDRLINIDYPTWSILLHSQSNPLQCERMVHEYPAMKRRYSCLAVIPAGIDASYNLLRHEEPPTGKELLELPESERTNSTGFFDNVANPKGRRLLQRKMSKLLQGLEDLEQLVLNTLLIKSGLKPGDEVVVMVVNAGEMDIFANFICSLHRYNLQHLLRQMIVFSGQEDVLTLIQAFGVIGIYHEASFASVPRRASYEYLDPIFIDMMWYKSFSVWLLLKLGFNVLFQDVDLIWFKNPFDYFHLLQGYYTEKYASHVPLSFHKHFQVQDESTSSGSASGGNGGKGWFGGKTKRGTLMGNSKYQISSDTTHDGGPDGFFSDDGQRSLRYAPFYANSGFYYLKSNQKMIYFTWSIMSAFALLHITGSHQNVFTVKLLEGLDITGIRPMMLPMNDFPSGVKYSHDRPFMTAIKDGHERPYIFHM